MLRLLVLISGVASWFVAALPAAAQSAPKFLNRTATEWASRLDNPDAVARRSAAFALGTLGKYALSALPEVRKHCQSETDAAAREALVTALGELLVAAGDADRDSQQVLIDLLQRDPDRYVRRSAACALGQLGPVGLKSDAVLVALDKALTDPEQVVRQNAAWALGQLDAKAAPLLVAALHDTSSDALVKRDAANALFAVAKQQPALMRPALPDLLEMCRDEQAEVRKAALIPLARLVTRKDVAAVPALKRVLKDRDVEVRRFAAFALSSIGGADAAGAVPVLLEALRKGEANVKKAAAMALHNLGDVASPAVPELTKALESGDPALARDAALALGGIGPAASTAVPALVRVVLNAELPSELRIEAAEALTFMGGIPIVRDHLPSVLKTLANSAEDGHLRVRLAWILTGFVSQPKSINEAKPVMEQVCQEPATARNSQARYHCAYLMGIAFQGKAPEAALNVLSEWLFDDNLKMYNSKSAEVGTVGTEINEASKVTLSLDGDARTMAIEALQFIGRDRVAARAEIVEQLQKLRNDAKSVPELRKKSGDLLKLLGKDQK